MQSMTSGDIRSSLRVILIVVLLPIFEPRVSIADDARRAEAPINFNFRDSPTLPDGFGPHPNTTLAPLCDEDGYVVDLTNDGAELSAAGLSAKLDLQGDFEVSLGYQAQEVALPRSGVGSGPKIYMHLGKPRRSTNGTVATLAHFVGPDGQAKYITMLQPTNSENRLYRAFDAPLPTAGRLTITRTGRLLIFSVAHEGSDVRELARVPVTAEKMTLLRFLNSTSGFGNSRIAFEDVSIVRRATTFLTTSQSLVSLFLLAGFVTVLFCAFRSVLAKGQDKIDQAVEA